LQIAIISDTHLKEHSAKLELLGSHLTDADLVVHAGDYGDYQIMNYFRNRFNFIGVWGNVDDNSIRSSLNEKEIIQIGALRIGIVHGHGEKKNTPMRAFDAFDNTALDVIIFGHSHQPSISTKNKVLMLNPGSAFQKRKERWFSYISLIIDHAELHASLILFNN